MPTPPGIQHPNPPALPNVTPDAHPPAVPASWDDFGRTAAVVFAYLSEHGQEAANRLIAWINQERAKRP